MFRGVLAPGVGVEHVVERLHHLADALQVLRRRVGQRVAHAGELRVEHLGAQQILDLLVLLARLGGAPLVVAELADGTGGVVRQRVEFGLSHARRVVRVWKQGTALGADGLVEQLADLLQRAVELPATAQFAGTLTCAAAKGVQPVPAAGPASE